MSFKEMTVQATELSESEAQKEIRRIYNELGGDGDRMLIDLINHKKAMLCGEYRCTVRSMPSEAKPDPAKAYLLNYALVVGLDRKELSKQTKEPNATCFGIVDNSSTQAVFEIGGPSHKSTTKSFRQAAPSLARSIGASVLGRISQRVASHRVCHFLDLRRCRLRCEEGSSSLQVRYMLRSKPGSPGEARLATRLAVLELEFQSPDVCEQFRERLETCLALVDVPSGARAPGNSKSLVQPPKASARREWSSKLAHTGRRKISVEPPRTLAQSPAAFFESQLNSSGATLPDSPAASIPNPTAAPMVPANIRRSSKTQLLDRRRSAACSTVPQDTSKLSPSQKRSQELLKKLRNKNIADAPPAAPKSATLPSPVAPQESSD